ncbi:MAG: hypothetical protein ABI867_35915 [Kofleriaceae bacterium]
MIYRTVFVLLALVLGAPRGFADAKQDAMLAPFAAMEKALRASDEPGFKARWYPDGYTKNLIGGSGISGASVYAQGSRKSWYLKPDLAKLTVLAGGAVAIVGCDIWSWDKERAVDHVDAVIVKIGNEYVMLGGGEKRAEVDALAKRWIAKKPLAAKE